MANNQQILRHGRVTQHSSVRMEKTRLLQPVVRESSFAAKGSSFQGHVSSSHYETHVSVVHAFIPDVEPNVVMLDSFLRGPSDLSLLPLYAHHVAVHVWEGEVA